MTTKTFTHERTGRILAGLSVLAALCLALLNPWFLLAAVGTALNLVLSGITDRCAVKNLLIRVGFPGERDLGRAEAIQTVASGRVSAHGEGTALRGGITEQRLRRCRQPAASRGTGGRSMANRLTARLQVLEAEAAAAPERFSFGEGHYTIRVANDLESRRKAYRLVYQLYLEKEYTSPHPSRMWLSIFDALPETVTLLVEKQAEGCGLKAEGKTEASSSPSAFGLRPSVPSVPVGALTVVFDSPMGLPADELYRPELDTMRAVGRRIAEVTSLGVAEEASAGSQILVKLFNFAYFVARGGRGATDFVVTVNPRHVKFYERLMCFAEAGPERAYDKVGGAPAVLLNLDFDLAERQRQAAVRGEEQDRRSIYRQFRAVGEELETVAALGRQLRPMSEAELGRFFVAETDLLARATPGQRAFIQGQYLTCDPAVNIFG